jgi:hypothetical protein
MDTTQLNLLIPIVLSICSPLFAKLGLTQEQASGTVGWVLSYGVPAGSAVWAWFQTQRAARLKRAAATSGVVAIHMDSDAGAAALGKAGANDNILGPSEVPAAVVGRNGIKAVVMSTEAAAKAIPNDNVVGPSKLAA